ncbi:hypothetical protein HMPREF0880_04405 [Yokenella regensburgei ATCC 43003]|nr:hypothetical protein HMPREF0880_04405 [Yokenella regensburgei ATCC 43003]
MKGGSNYNNYRYDYWIMCAASRKMRAHFTPRRVKVVTPAGE